MNFDKSTTGLIPCGRCRVYTEGDNVTADHMVFISFRTVKWAMFVNENYEEDVKLANNGTSKYYKMGGQGVPVYRVMKNKKKFAPALLRHNDKGESFIFIPVRSKNKTQRNYYIFDIESDGRILDGAPVYFSMYHSALK